MQEDNYNEWLVKNIPPDKLASVLSYYSKRKGVSINKIVGRKNWMYELLIQCIKVIAVLSAFGVGIKIIRIITGI